MSDEKKKSRIVRRYVQDSVEGMESIAPKQQQQQPRETSQRESSENKSSSDSKKE